MILTVGSDDGLRDQVSAGLRDTQWATPVSNVVTVGEAQDILRGPSPPRVVVVGRSVGVHGAGDVAAVASSLRSPPLVLLVDTPTTTTLRAAMRAGIRDVLPVQFTSADLVATLREAGVTGGGPEPLPGLTVAVFSTKGGVGTSVVACNLANRLAAQTGAGTALVDLDLASADQSIMHGLAPRWTIQDLADGAVGLDEESLSQVLVTVDDETGMALLPGPVDPALAETITGSDVATIVAAVRAQSPIAVLDLASGFDDRTLAGLDAADVVVVVTSLDVAALRALTVSLQTMERLGIEPNRILLALNRADSKSGLVVADVERAVDRTIDVGLPSTRAVPRSVNEGVPLAVSTPRSAVVQALDDLVALLIPRLPEGVLEEDADGRRSRGGLFARSRGRAGTPAPSVTPEPAPGRAEGTPLPPPAVGDDEAVDDDAVDDDAVDDNVRQIRVRRASEPAKRRVLRAPKAATAAESAAADEEDPPAPPEPPVHVVRTLEELPPPAVAVDDDDDDQPRRRRRR